ncbi:MAG: hypothetical protein MUC36_19655 [Planctomycetes bacterium]|nr:hypothetical protein [Planctomycetota bacterium]
MNPDDIYIQPDVRAELAAFMDRISPEIVAINEMLGKVAVHEAESFRHHPAMRTLEGARRRKHVDGVESDAVVFDLSVQEEVGAAVFLGAEGGMVVVPQNLLPVTRSLRDRKMFLASEVGVAVVEWFRTRGYCSKEAAQAAVLLVAEDSQRFHCR